MHLIMGWIRAEREAHLRADMARQVKEAVKDAVQNKDTSKLEALFTAPSRDL
jgi:hypothetical protein